MLKKATTAPVNLYEATVRQENSRHQGRLNELKMARARIEQLEKLVPALTAAGVTIYPEQIELRRGLLDNKRYVNVLHLSFGEVSQHLRGEKTRDVLLTHGFKETRSHDYSTWSSVILSKGHLHISLYVSSQAPDVKAASTPSASPVTA